MSKSTNIAIAVVLLHAAAGLMVASGVAADWGVQPQPGGGANVEAAQTQAENLNPSSGGGGTLFGLYTSAANALRGIVGVVFALEFMLANLGIPVWLTTFLFAPAPLIVGLDIYYAITGRRVSA